MPLRRSPESLRPFLALQIYNKMPGVGKYKDVGKKAKGALSLRRHAHHRTPALALNPPPAFPAAAHRPPQGQLRRDGLQRPQGRQQDRQWRGKLKLCSATKQEQQLPLPASSMPLRPRASGCIYAQAAPPLAPRAHWPGVALRSRCIALTPPLVVSRAVPVVLRSSPRRARSAPPGPRPSSSLPPMASPSRSSRPTPRAVSTARLRSTTPSSPACNFRSTSRMAPTPAPTSRRRLSASRTAPATSTSRRPATSPTSTPPCSTPR